MFERERERDRQRDRERKVIIQFVFVGEIISKKINLSVRKDNQLNVCFVKIIDKPNVIPFYAKPVQYSKS